MADPVHIAELLEAASDGEAVMLAPRQVYDQALVGMAQQAGGQVCAAYSFTKIIDLQVAAGADFNEAADHLYANILGSMIGEHAPIILFDDVL